MGFDCLVWVVFFFSDTGELMDFLDAVNNSLEGAGYQEKLIQVQCMYGKYVADDLRLRSIVNTFWGHESIYIIYRNPLRR